MITNINLKQNKDVFNLNKLLFNKKKKKIQVFSFLFCCCYSNTKFQIIEQREKNIFLKKTDKYIYKS
jgi:hypothetical protein